MQNRIYTLTIFNRDQQAIYNTRDDIYTDGVPAEVEILHFNNVAGIQDALATSMVREKDTEHFILINGLSDSVLHQFQNHGIEIEEFDEILNGADHLYLTKRQERIDAERAAMELAQRQAKQLAEFMEQRRIEKQQAAELAEYQRLKALYGE